MKPEEIYAFFDSYSKAVRSSDIDQIVCHYAQPYIAHALGNTFHFPDRAAAKASAASHIAKLRQWGLSNARVIDVPFTIISETAAMAFPLWEVQPEKGDHWHMRLVYGLRKHPEGVLAELAVGDGEAIQMMQRYPDFFKTDFAPKVS